MTPILMMTGFTLQFMKKEEGDLSRFVYLPEAAAYRKLFVDSFMKIKMFDDLFSLSLPLRKKYKIVTLGDSFSEKQGSGYQQRLAKMGGGSLLHLSSRMHPDNNQFNSLAGLANGDFLSKAGTKYVIFQIVERSIYYRVREYDSVFTINYSDIGELAENVRNSKKNQQPYPIDQLLKFPIQNIYFHLDKKTELNQVRKFRSTQKLFSTEKDQILVYEDDIKSVSENNKSITAKKFNDILNSSAKKLKEAGITLIVFVAPDKFDFYFDEIVQKKDLTRPSMLDNIRHLPKEYCYLDIKAHLKELKLKGEKDIYLYDDTHWSVSTNNQVAKWLFDIMKDSQAVGYSH